MESDEEELDQLLQEIGIPASAEKRKRVINQKSGCQEIVDLSSCCSPVGNFPQTKKSTSQGSSTGGLELVDLTSPTPTKPKKPSTASLASSTRREEVTTDAICTLAQLPVARPRKRRRQERQEPTKPSPKPRRPIDRLFEESASLRPESSIAKSTTDTTSACPSRQVTNGHQRPRQTHIRTKSQQETSQRVITNAIRSPPSAVGVAFESRLTQTQEAETLQKAVQEHIYNGKRLQVSFEEAFDHGLHAVSMPDQLFLIRIYQRIVPNQTFVVVYWKASGFLDALALGYDEVRRTMGHIRMEMNLESGQRDSLRVVLLLEGIDAALVALKKAAKRKQSSTAKTRVLNVNASDISRVLFQLHMEEGYQSKICCDLQESAEYVAMLTREAVVATSSQEVSSLLDLVPRLHSFRVNPNGDTCNPYSNTWLRMLQMIPGVSEPKAQAICDSYPTFQSLFAAMNDAKVSIDARQDLLADKFAGHKIERALSKRIFNVFYQQDTRTLI